MPYRRRRYAVPIRLHIPLVNAAHTHRLVQAAVLENVLIDTLVNTQNILYFVHHGFQRPCMPHLLRER